MRWKRVRGVEVAVSGLWFHGPWCFAGGGGGEFFFSGRGGVLGCGVGCGGDVSGGNGTMDTYVWVHV